MVLQYQENDSLVGHVLFGSLEDSKCLKWCLLSILLPTGDKTDIFWF